MRSNLGYVSVAVFLDEGGEERVSFGETGFLKLVAETTACTVSICGLDRDGVGGRRDTGVEASDRTEV